MFRCLPAAFLLLMLAACEQPLLETSGKEPPVRVRPAPGTVTWWWVTPDENEGPPLTSPIPGTCRGREVVFFGADDENGWFYAVDVSTGATAASMWPVVAECGWFTGHPAYCSWSGHLLVGHGDGEFYTMRESNLQRDWHWPGHTHEDSLTWIPWGVPAVNGRHVYVPRDNDSIYHFVDMGSFVRFEGARHIPGLATTATVDRNGYVYTSDDSGYVYKLRPDLSGVVWRFLVCAGAEVLPVVIGDEGDVYCVPALTGLAWRLTPDGNVVWNHAVVGPLGQFALGDSLLFVGASGCVVALRRHDGWVRWRFDRGGEQFKTSPLLLSNGLMYVQALSDSLYCLRSTNGELVWACDCKSYGPWPRGRPRRDLSWIPGSPTLTSDGDIIVVGEYALYCVSGYLGTTLADAAWPKWQRDLKNTGKAGP